MSHRIARLVLAAACVFAFAPRALNAAVPIPPEAVYDDTILVLHIDAAQVTPEKVRQALAAVSTPDMAMMLDASMAQYQDFYSRFTQAGGAAITFALRVPTQRPQLWGASASSSPKPSEPEPLIVITPRDKVDKEIFARTMITLMPSSDASSTEWRNDKLLVMPAPLRFPAASRMSATRLADFTNALSDAGPKASITAAMIPTEAMRKMMMPMLKEPGMPAPVAALAANLIQARHMTLAFEVTDQPAYALTVGHKDETSAKLLNSILSGALAMGAQALTTNFQGMPGIDEAAQTLVTGLQPTQTASAVTIRVDTKTLNTLNQTVTPVLVMALMQAKQNALTVVSENNLRGIGNGIMFYAQDNNGNAPDSLDDLLSPTSFVASKEDLIDPRTGEPYIYVKPETKLMELRRPDQTPIVYESRNGQIDPNGAVLYADGHVEPGTPPMPGPGMDMSPSSPDEEWNFGPDESFDSNETPFK